MKKNRRILGRVLATEISDDDLHKVTGQMEEGEDGGSCSLDGGADAYGGTIIIHHTCYHTDCHIEGYDCT
ncbi:MAG TPA: hypothetical protein VGG03_13455 [Thermoanaerobaculia bacterium]|jgi:hypothetical protein